MSGSGMYELVRVGNAKIVGEIIKLIDDTGEKLDRCVFLLCSSSCVFSLDSVLRRDCWSDHR